MRKCVLGFMVAVFALGASTALAGSNNYYNYNSFDDAYYYYSTSDLTDRELEQMRYDLEEYLDNADEDIARIEAKKREAIEFYEEALRKKGRSSYYY